MCDEEKLCFEVDCPCCVKSGARIGVEEVTLNHVVEMNKREEARKKLVKALEDAGVDLPVKAFEAMLNRDDLEYDNYSCYDLGRAISQLSAEHEESVGAQLNALENKDKEEEADGDDEHDELRGVPEDLRNLLLRSAGTTHLTGIDPGTKSFSGTKSVSLRSTAETEAESDPGLIPIPRAPLGSTKRGSVAVIETGDTIEAQDSARSKFALASKDSSRVTVIFPKEKNRRMYMGIAFCCLLQLALVGVVLYFAVFRESETSDLSTVTPTSNDTDFFGISSNQTVGGKDPVLVAGGSTGEDGTAVPTEDETVQVTVAPTMAPTSTPAVTEQTGCFDSIVPDELCYPRGRQIVVLFTTCEAQEDDWMGIYDASVDPTALGDDYIDWMWTCGNKECRGLVNSNIVAFMDRFQQGTYRLHLIRQESNEDGTYTAYASSEEFDVKTNLLDCSP